MKVSTEEISGVEVEIHADPHSGKWRVVHDDDTLGSGDTLGQAKAAARTVLAKRKAKVHVEFVTHAGERGFATGIHSKNRTILARIDGNAEQLQGYRDGFFRPNIPQETLDEYLRLSEEVRTRTRRMGEIERVWGFNLRPEVERALAGAALAAVKSEPA